MPVVLPPTVHRTVAFRLVRIHHSDKINPRPAKADLGFMVRMTGFEPAASCSQTCLRMFVRRFPTLFDAFRCSRPCCLALSGTLVSARCFQLMGWVRDAILYIKRCVSQDWTGDTENMGPAAEVQQVPCGFMQILRWCKQGKKLQVPCLRLNICFPKNLSRISVP